MNVKLARLILFSAAVLVSVSCGAQAQRTAVPVVPAESLSANVRKILESAELQTKTTTEYTQQYFEIAFPNGDVPENTGACTDVVIRAFRSVGIDLQKEVHEDMKANFSKYPTKWGLEKPDTNIDHRRVLNLQVFFDRLGKSVPVPRSAAQFKPGDIVTWDLDGKGMTHIGIVSNTREKRTGAPLIYHNIGEGARLENRLFEWKITGVYRYF